MIYWKKKRKKKKLFDLIHNTRITLSTSGNLAFPITIEELVWPKLAAKAEYLSFNGPIIYNLWYIGCWKAFF